MIAHALRLESYSKQRDLGQALDDPRSQLRWHERVKYSGCNFSPFFGYWNEEFN
jgi:hypothetical protein